MSRRPASIPLRAGSRGRTASAAGFTLLELNIALAIVAILAALAVPAYQDHLERARLAAVMLQIDAIRTKAQAHVASRGLDLCDWPATPRHARSTPDMDALEQIVREGFQALDPTGRTWPPNMNGLVPGKPPIGPTMQIVGKGPNAHRVHLLRAELERAGLMVHLAMDRPTITAFQVRLGPPCR